MEKYKVGDIIYNEKPITINEKKESIEILVSNSGDRAVQVGSHYHFFECNFALIFDREKAFGRHLDIPAGTAVRFEPGDEIGVSLVEFSGDKKILGFNGMTMGNVESEEIRIKAIEKAHHREREGW